MSIRQRKAVLRVCASCEWIFRITEYSECPKCGFAHYGARFVYGKKAYQFEKTQKPWFDKKIENFKCKLFAEIQKSKIDKSKLLKFKNANT